MICSFYELTYNGDRIFDILGRNRDGYAEGRIAHMAGQSRTTIVFYCELVGSGSQTGSHWPVLIIITITIWNSHQIGFCLGNTILFLNKSAACLCIIGCTGSTIDEVPKIAGACVDGGNNIVQIRNFACRYGTGGGKRMVVLTAVMHACKEAEIVGYCLIRGRGIRKCHRGRISTAEICVF